jgi:hypothetical protein
MFNTRFLLAIVDHITLILFDSMPCDAVIIDHMIDIA